MHVWTNCSLALIMPWNGVKKKRVLASIWLSLIPHQTYISLELEFYLYKKLGMAISEAAD